MSNSFFMTKTDNFKGSNNTTIVIDLKDDNAYSDIMPTLSNNPNSTIIIKGINSVEVFNHLISLLTRRTEYSGTVILDVVSKDNSLSDLERHDLLDLFNIPYYVKIKGFLPNNEQNAFSTWSHNLGRKFKEVLSDHLVDRDKEMFLSQEEIINDFSDKYDKSIGWYSDKNIMFRQIFKFVQEHYSLDRNLADDDFTGCIPKPDSLWASNPIAIYKMKKGTSEGRANLLTLLANNSVYDINCNLVMGQLANGHSHYWNEVIDSNGNITHYDLAFNIESMSDSDFQDKKERYAIEEYSWVKSQREFNSETKPPVTYVFKPNALETKDNK